MIEDFFKLILQSMCIIKLHLVHCKVKRFLSAYDKKYLKVNISLNSI